MVWYCDFDSNWKHGLEIHMTRKHSQMVQLDGNITFDSVELEDVKYENTSHYWKRGRLGINYQPFVDANLIIDNSNLSVNKEGVTKFNEEHAMNLTLREASTRS